MKCKPFLPRWGSLTYIISVAAVQPYWILEIIVSIGRSLLATFHETDMLHLIGERKPPVCPGATKVIEELTAPQFLYFSNTSNLFVYIRPYEALFRDPWYDFLLPSLLTHFLTITTKRMAGGFSQCSIFSGISKSVTTLNSGNLFVSHPALVSCSEPCFSAFALLFSTSSL